MIKIIKARKRLYELFEKVSSGNCNGFFCEKTIPSAISLYREMTRPYTVIAVLVALWFICKHKRMDD